ncbi:GntR family transcriptional regulator [Nocardioides sp. SYSU DS0651]|uniref:GntR family transcriptional regulator n=1 Tax=Nocardioides sp. SYSU DS0651 TaxID=3415955 RepID=UPI003F4BB19D
MTIREYVRDLVADSAPGTAAPSERDLVDRFGVARMTVRQALDALVAEGVLERFPGRGTFVARPARVPTGISSLTEEFARRGQVAEARTLVAARRRPSTRLASTLGIGPDQPVIHWRRLRLADGRPVCLSDAYLPESLVPGLLERLPASLYDDLAARGRRPTWAEDSMSAGVASEDEAAALEIAVGGVVLRHSRKALWGDVVIEVSRTVFRGDQHKVCVQLRG